MGIATIHLQRNRTTSLLVLLALGLCLLATGWRAALGAGQQAPAKAFKLATTAFTPGGDIPRKFTCEGADVSPALTWTEPPAGTKSFALIADDPDAPRGTFVHWVVYNLPATARRLSEATPGNDEMSGGGRQGMDDFPMSGNLLRCARCNFKGICEQGVFAQMEECPPVEDLGEA